MPGTSSHGGIKQPQLPGGRMAAKQRGSPLTGPWGSQKSPFREQLDVPIGVPLALIPQPFIKLCPKEPALRCAMKN